MGHPIGASGARVLVTLLYEMAPRREKGDRDAVHRRRHGDCGVRRAIERFQKQEGRDRRMVVERSETRRWRSAYLMLMGFAPLTHARELAGVREE